MNSMSFGSLSREAMDHAIQNVFLPPKLPQSGDDTRFTHDRDLILGVVESLDVFKSYLKLDDKAAVAGAHGSIYALHAYTNDTGSVNEQQLDAAFSSLLCDKVYLPIPVKAQNAAILLSYDGHSVLFECFELSPPNETVMSTQGRLRRSFPASSVAIPTETWDGNHRSAIAGAIAKMSHQEVIEMKPKVRKAGEFHTEERDTTSPALVTDFLCTFMRAVGQPTKAPGISKNTREEVLWRDTKLPWRRSPVWLLVRVSLQLIFSRMSKSATLYKQFMIFLMTRLLETARQGNVSSDLLYCMVAKISRRLLKLGQDLKHPWLSTVERVLLETKAEIENRWDTVQRVSDPPLSVYSFSAADLNDGVSAIYPKLDDFITKIHSRETLTHGASFGVPWNVFKFDKNSVPHVTPFGFDEPTFFNLSAIEKWVASSLDSWLEVHIKRVSTCQRLCEIIESYHATASRCYQGNPESLSLMFLTLLELWVACDKSARGQHPLMSEYDPKIPCELTESLLLPFRDQMKRLCRIEAYVNARRCAANPRNPYIFSSFGQENSFALQFVASSEEHKELLEQIESEAARERKAKSVEFRQKQAEYSRLMRLHNQTECRFLQVVDQHTGYSQKVHYHGCKSCEYLESAHKLSIEVHEWPLPSDERESRAAVFELMVPQPFTDWRDATMFLLFDVFKPACQISGKGPKWTLESYLPHFFKGLAGRVIAGSLKKPNRGTHRRGKAIATATESDILVKNGLGYSYYDSKSCSIISEPVTTDEIPRMCMHQLSRPCADNLQEFLFRPSHLPNGLTPNHVVSGQSSCPDHLSLEEFKAMASLPIGYRIQWANILVQLYAPVIDLKKLDTVYALLQVIHQAGPPLDNSEHRAGHQQLSQERFVETCLQGLSLSLDGTQENWESYRAVGALTSIATRLLTLSPSSTASEKCLEFLQRCRLVALRWVRTLQERAQQAEEDTERVSFLETAFQVAHVCASSFDVDEDHLRSILEETSIASILIESSIVIRTTMQSVSTSGRDVSILSHRWRRLLFRAQPILLEQIINEKNECLDLAIKKSWSAYPGSDHWDPVSRESDHWLATHTASRTPSASLPVHFNLLTAELLVNGLPLARLPATYETHPSYRILFGRTALEVMPTDVSGFRFSSKKSHHGYNIFFNLAPDSEELHLMLQGNADESLDLIPSNVFQDMLPDRFVTSYVHWYSHESRTIEFRPINDPWNGSETYWRMQKISGSRWVLERNGESLLCPWRNPAKLILQSLSSLESAPHIHIIVNQDATEVDVEMPRIQLRFSQSVSSHKLLSRQYRGMYVDSHQNVGALTGLANKLVLKDDRGNRKLLLLEGHVSWAPANGHVKVTVFPGSSSKIHPYEVDTLLGRLVDNGSIQSQLVLAYLHAVTSYCIPDKLTGKTGTEQCLSILGSAAVRSFGCLSGENTDVLAAIANLSPQRAYYPENERVMESVLWDLNLSFLSQNEALRKAVKSIFTQSTSTKLFYRDSYIEPPELAESNTRLEARHSIRRSVFQVSEFGAENHTLHYDAVYSCRDSAPCSKRSDRAFRVSTMVLKNRDSLHERISSNYADNMWSIFMSGSDTIGPRNLLSQDMMYDAKWLRDMDLNVRRYWCSFHHTLGTQLFALNRVEIALCFATMAYAENTDHNVVQTLAAFATIRSLRQIEIPDYPSFAINKGRRVCRKELRNIMEQHFVSFSNCPEATSTRWPYETESQLHERRRSEFQANQDRMIDRFVDSLETQWVCNAPRDAMDGDVRTYIKSTAISFIRDTWRHWYQNHLFYLYLSRIEDELSTCRIASIQLPAGQEMDQPTTHADKQRAFISEHDLFEDSVPLLPDTPQSAMNFIRSDDATLKNRGQIAGLIRSLEKRASREHERKYTEELQTSRLSLSNYGPSNSITLKGEKLRGVLWKNLLESHYQVKIIYQALTASVCVDKKDSSALPVSSGVLRRHISTRLMSPRISQSFFLQQLSRRRWQNLPTGWKQAVVAYGLALTKLQQACRMVRVCDNEADLLKELLNTGHTNWSPMDYPESLLLEVESGIVIRDVQEEIASKMRYPPENNNAVMQLNMGEGKSSVILPIVAAHLADGKKLVRVVVAKPQAKELLRTLVGKLGGLLDHQVYHMPFSRSLKLAEHEAYEIKRMYEKCMKTGGILLVQPEHILSFKLMGIESCVSGQESVGRILSETQHFFNQCSRDLVDECDENFSVKFELIYTMGTQRPVELSPERWVYVQRVLSIIAKLAPGVQERLSQSIEVTHNKRGQFPRTRILRRDAQELLLQEVAQEICNTGLPGLPIARQSPEVRDSVFHYISDVSISQDHVKIVENRPSFFNESTKGPLLLLRGLIAEGVLGFTLGQKRWRVNYGLDPNRNPATRLAVPFRAKDNPAPRSEFSHPDVVMLFTCLSYYYGGLSDDYLFQSFDHLINSDQADLEYYDWVKDAPTLPRSFRGLSGINMKDRHQIVCQVFPHLRYAKSVVDYFLAHIVFRKEMKEFPQKLSASGWDIGAKKAHPTTGFSGTIDSRPLLPLDVTHLDLETQRHTNALVLEYLLQPENTVEHLAQPEEGSIARALVNRAVSMEPPVQVILDVGAQILELTNIEVAKTWLEMLPKEGGKEAVVFFDDHDDLCVINRHGFVGKLQESPYSRQLDVCLVFLDEAHTRGTDLKLPDDYRAAITLGANLTKDRLVQACMRMRKLGKGQSVVFCISEEIKAKIIDFAEYPPNTNIQVSDVLMWAISETQADHRRTMALWAMQGLRFGRQKKLWADSTTSDGLEMSQEQADRFLEDDASTLEKRYRPLRDGGISFMELEGLSEASEDPHVVSIRERCIHFDIDNFKSSVLQEEQERELSPEIEQERQIEKPHPLEPQAHHLHQDIMSYVETGILEAQSKAVMPAFEALRNTTAASHFDLSQWPKTIRVTADFARTVKLTVHRGSADSYQRPIQWILSTAGERKAQNLLIISPFEAQLLLPRIEKSKAVSLHVYTPRLNLAFQSLDKLKLFPVPPSPAGWKLARASRLLLNVFAGQLYFNMFKDYVETCKALRLSWEASGEEGAPCVDGFIAPGPDDLDNGFQESPTKFLKVLLATIRRDCGEIDRTHWGRILGGEVLKESDFEES